MVMVVVVMVMVVVVMVMVVVATAAAVAAALGFTTPLTSQVTSVAFYSEREKFDKFCSEALISA